MSIYSTGTRVLAAAAWAFCAFFALNLVLTGTAGALWHFLPPLLLVAWAIHLLLWRPRLLVDAGGLTVVNILREHRIPFGALKAVRVAQGVSLDTTAGRIASWGVPGAGRLGPRRGGAPGSGKRIPAKTPSQTAIESAWDAWERAAPEKDGTDDGGTSSAVNTPTAVTGRWNIPAGVVSLVLVALAVASVLS